MKYLTNLKICYWDWFISSPNPAWAPNTIQLPARLYYTNTSSTSNPLCQELNSLFSLPLSARSAFFFLYWLMASSFSMIQTENLRLIHEFTLHPYFTSTSPVLCCLAFFYLLFCTFPFLTSIIDSWYYTQRHPVEINSHHLIHFLKNLERFNIAQRIKANKLTCVNCMPFLISITFWQHIFLPAPPCQRWDRSVCIFFNTPCLCSWSYLCL